MPYPTNRASTIGFEDEELLLDRDEELLLDRDEELLLDRDERLLLDPDEPLLLDPDEEPLLEVDDEPLLEADEEPPLDPDEEPPLDTDDEPPLDTADEPVLDTADEPALETEEEPPLETDDEPPLDTDDEPPLDTDDEPPLDPDEAALLGELPDDGPPEELGSGVAAHVATGSPTFPCPAFASASLAAAPKACAADIEAKAGSVGIEAKVSISQSEPRRQEQRLRSAPGFSRFPSISRDRRISQPFSPPVRATALMTPSRPRLPIDATGTTQ